MILEKRIRAALVVVELLFVFELVFEPSSTRTIEERCGTHASNVFEMLWGGPTVLFVLYYMY